MKSENEELIRELRLRGACREEVGEAWTRGSAHIDEVRTAAAGAELAAAQHAAYAPRSDAHYYAASAARIANYAVSAAYSAHYAADAANAAYYATYSAKTYVNLCALIRAEWPSVPWEKK